MRQSLLEIIQDLCSDLNLDPVDDIYDTVESEQLANIVKKTYERLLIKRYWPQNEHVVAFEALGDSDLPTSFNVPLEVQEICSIKYNCVNPMNQQDNWVEMKYLEPEVFIQRYSARTNAPHQPVTITGGLVINVRSDLNPTHFTSFDGQKTLFFDSYNKVVDGTLQTSKLVAKVYQFPVFDIDNDFVPDMPAEAFPVLYDGALELASLRINMRHDPLATRDKERGEAWLSQKSGAMSKQNVFVGYGRRRNAPKKHPTFKRYL